MIRRHVEYQVRSERFRSEVTRRFLDFQVDITRLHSEVSMEITKRLSDYQLGFLGRFRVTGEKNLQNS